MKVTQGINPNCSEIVVPLRSKWGDIEALKVELKNMLSNTDLEIGMYGYRIMDNKDVVVRSKSITPDDLYMGIHPEAMPFPEDHNWKALLVKSPAGLRLKDIENAHEFKASLFKKGLTDTGNVEIVEENTSNNPHYTIRISEESCSKFPVLLEALKMGYTYYPDGGGSSALDWWLHDIGLGELSINDVQTSPDDADVKWISDKVAGTGYNNEDN